MQITLPFIKVENLKQNIADMEEKVQYQSEERLRDIHDLLDSCHTRVRKNKRDDVP